LRGEEPSQAKWIYYSHQLHKDWKRPASEIIKYLQAKYYTYTKQ
jgi:hypothetical protein